MHPALTLKEIAARKAVLCAESEQLRCEIQTAAAKVQPVVAAIDFGMAAMRQFRRCQSIASALLGDRSTERSKPEREKARSL